MPEYDNTPPVAIAISQPPSNTAPVAKSIDQALSNTAPVAVAISQSPSNTAPTSRDLSAPGVGDAPEVIAINQSPSNTAPVAKAIAGVTPDNTAPAAVDLTTARTPSNAAAVPITAAPLSSINMPASFQPAFTELTGGGNCLDSLSATAADLNKVLQGTVNGELKSYQVRAGSDAAALPGIVRPANFVLITNAVVFVQL